MPAVHAFQHQPKLRRRTVHMLYLRACQGPQVKSKFQQEVQNNACEQAVLCAEHALKTEYFACCSQSCKGRKAGIVEF